MDLLHLKKQQLLDFVVKYKLFVIFVSVKFRLPEKASVKVFMHSQIGTEIAGRLRSINSFLHRVFALFSKSKVKTTR